jgi:hypothetical protein
MFACTLNKSNNENSGSGGTIGDDIDINSIITNTIITNSLEAINISAETINVININGVSYDQIGGQKLVNYFDYYFIDKPWPPVYINGGHYYPPTQNRDGYYILGIYDSSSGVYNNTKKQIELRWQLPTQTTAGMNFASPPRRLNGDGVTLDVGQYSSNGFDNTMYNKLPYIETLKVAVRYTISNEPLTSSDWEPWVTFLPDMLSNPDTLALGSNLNLFPEVKGINFQSVLGVQPVLGSYIDEEKIYLNIGNKDSIIQSGANKKFQFRIHLENSNTSSEASWNYLYIPGNNDTSGIDFGNFHAAYPPFSINIVLNNYKLLNINGLGGEYSESPVEQGLDTPFSALDTAGLAVNYGFILTVNNEGWTTISNNSVQFEKPPSTYQNIDLGIAYESNDTSFHSWNINNNQWVQNTENASSNSNTIVFPGYTYAIIEYYMKMTTGITTKTYFTGSYPVTITVNAPTRSQVTNGTSGNYYNYLPETTIQSGSLVKIQGNDATYISVYTNASIQKNVHFFHTNSSYKIEFAEIKYLRNSKTDNENISLSTNLNTTGDFGTKLIDQSLCRFKLSCGDSNVNAIELSSEFSKGFTGNDQQQFKTNDYFEFIQSESKDAVNDSHGLIDTYRLRGWYLGVDISGIKIKNINLATYPDICNNGFDAWPIKLEQVFSGSNGHSEQISIYHLYIAERPNTDISLENYSQQVQTNPIIPTTANFFGLIRPIQNIVYHINGNLNNINKNWKRNLNMELLFNLMYNNNGTDYVSIYKDNIIIDETTQKTGSKSINNLTLTIPINKLQNDYKFSRSTSNTPQFKIRYTFDNNPTQDPISFITEHDIEDFKIERLWWDYTWDDTTNGTLPATSSLWSVTGSNNTSLTFMKSGNGHFPDYYHSTNNFTSVYDHTQAIEDNVLMWCKDSFKTPSTTSDNPYIDYSNYYNNTYNYSDNNIKNGGTQINELTNTSEFNLLSNINDTSGTYKWIVLKSIKSSNASQKVIVKVFNINLQLTTGTEYLLYVLEDDTTISPDRKWKSAQHKYFEKGEATNNSENAGVNLDIETDAAHLQLWSNSTDTTIYYRIGLKNTSVNNIKYITLQYVDI